jgi:hypothetical protein
MQTTTIVKHEVSLEEINKVCYRSPYGKEHSNVGCAYFPTGDVCTIYVPKKSEYPEMRKKDPRFAKVPDLTIELFILGHETKHCFDKNWH